MADCLTKAQQIEVFKIEFLRVASRNGIAAIHHDQIGSYPMLGSLKDWSPLYVLVEIVQKLGLGQDLQLLDALIYDADHDGKHIWSCMISIWQRKYFTWLWIFPGTDNIELEDFLQLVDSLIKPMDVVKPILDSLVSAHCASPLLSSKEKRTTSYLINFIK